VREAGVSDLDARARALGELRALEESLWRSDVRYDRARMDAILAPDFFEYGRSGRAWTREEILATPASAIRATLLDFTARWLDERTAQTSYVSVLATPQGEERARRSSIWSRTDAGWKLRFHQGTPLPGGR
jgi:hypothetical protein